MVFTFAFEETVRQEFLKAVRDIVCGSSSSVNGDTGRIDLVRLTCDLDVLRQRIQDPGRTAFGKLTSFCEFNKLRTTGTIFEGRSGDDAMSVDTTDRTPEDSAMVIAGGLGILYTRDT